MDPLQDPHFQQAEDQELESLRPRKLSQFVGQTQVKKNLKVSIAAALKRGEALDHILLYGPPGLGKTTLAHIIAQEMGSQITVTSGPALERAGDLAAILTSLKPRDILFIDEVHRLPRAVEESLYSAMEDYTVYIVVGKGVGAQTIKLTLPPFTLIGATTRIGLISSPMRGRFGIVHYLDFYQPKDLEKMLEQNARKLNISATKEGIREIANRSRGTPRIANRLLKRVRDYAEIEAKGVVNEAIARKALSLLEVNDLGLDKRDLAFLEVLIETYKGGPVGIETLSAALSEEKDTLEEVYEPYLLQLGLIERTKRGRVATEKAYRLLQQDPAQQRLFEE